MKVKVKSLSRVRLFGIPQTVAYQASLSMGFSRQEYWSGVPLPSPGDLPDPGIEPRSPALQADALPSEIVTVNTIHQLIALSRKLMWLSLCCCCCSVSKSCLTLCERMNCSTPGFPVLHHLPEFAQTHVHWVGDAIQPSHPLSPPSPPDLNLSQH